MLALLPVIMMSSLLVHFELQIEDILYSSLYLWISNFNPENSSFFEEST
jgi:hypothetical protein